MHGQVFACSESTLWLLCLAVTWIWLEVGGPFLFPLCTNGPGRCFSHFIGP